jgi:hypothetical protein
MLSQKKVWFHTCGARKHTRSNMISVIAKDEKCVASERAG